MHFIISNNNAEVEYNFEIRFVSFPRPYPNCGDLGSSASLSYRLWSGVTFRLGIFNTVRCLQRENVTSPHPEEL